MAESEQKKNIAYQMARFHRRCFADLIDFLLFVLIGVGLFLGTRAIVSSTPGFQQNETALLSIREESGLYHVEGTSSEDIVTHIDHGDYTAYVKMLMCDDAVNGFIRYIGMEVSTEAASTVQKDYDEFRLSPSFVYNDGGVQKPYFIQDGSDIIRNPELVGKVTNNTYYLEVYSVFIDEHALGYLVTMVPEYLELVRYESNMLFFVEIPIAWVLGGFIVYFVPALFWRRGRMTFGKWSYRIGLANKDLLSCSLPRFFARWCIFFFGELTLSLFTFGIPCIVSFSLMAFSKRRQGLADYFLTLYEVDLTQAKLYFSFDEILFTGAAESKDPVAFQPTYED